jgi:hypothetical protein
MTSARRLPHALLGVALLALQAGAAPAASATDAAVPGVDGCLRLGFDVLGAFKYALPPDATGDQAEKVAVQAAKDIPANIRQLDGKRALVTGFMLPVKMEEGTGLVTDFLLVRDPMMCCYGVVPDPNDWVVVHMLKPVAGIQDIPLSFIGTLHVGPIYDNGYLTGIYRLEGEKKAD